MRNRRRAATLAIGLTLLLAISLSAQTKPDGTQTAPIPAQVASAKKVFIANGGHENPVGPLFKGGPNRTYDQFYAAMKSWGHYELVNAPADADLVCEIRLVIGFEPESRHPVIGLNLRLQDPKSGITLWTIPQQVMPANREKTWEKNYSMAMDALIDEMKKLAAGSSAVGNPQK